MRKTYTSAAVKARYNSKTYDRVTFVVKKGEADVIKAAAAVSGCSMSEYIVGAVAARMIEEGATPISTERKKSRLVV